jgi:serine/threonine protein kinase
VEAAALADELARFRVVDAVRLTKLMSGFSGSGPQALADYLVGRGALTAFQAARALAGEARQLALGPYRLTAPAGAGTFGPLYLAQHLSKPGTFVVRVLPLRSLWRAKEAKQLARALATRVGHPAVLPLVDVDSANGFHYLVWPLADGQRLAERVAATGPVPAGEAAALLGHLANALAACHACGVGHAALTPHAVAVGPNGVPCLLELGAGALLAESVAEDESLFDTMSAAFASAHVLAYAAPELADTPHPPPAPLDQYALGAVGYFALTGAPPYPHPALAEQIRAKRAGPPPSAAVVNPAVPAELAAVIGRMMAPNPADRFATLSEVEERLAAVAAADPTESARAAEILALIMSELKATPTPSSASSSWAVPGFGGVRPVPRDDTDASVTFDLPDAPETVPDRFPVHPPRASVETTPETAFGRRPERAARPEPPPPDAGRAHETPPDSRPVAPAIQWHAPEPPAGTPDPAAPEPDPDRSVLWRAVRQNLLFWQPPTDPVQVSVFGPTAIAPGRSVKLAVYLHTAEARSSVRTLSRALLQDAELIGGGYLAREVARDSELAVHLAVANAAVAKALLPCRWRGQPQRIVFDLHVPWESPEGAAPGLVSVGLKNVRIGKIDFHLNVLPGKA